MRGYENSTCRVKVVGTDAAFNLLLLICWRLSAQNAAMPEVKQKEAQTEWITRIIDSDSKNNVMTHCQNILEPRNLYKTLLINSVNFIFILTQGA